MTGRLHTCYSPVRRSPAGKTEVSPLLPLDLHVLSLSLAFILSQDQTLRCCILFFFFFSKIREQNFVCLFCSFTRPKRSYTRDICSIYLSKELTWVIHFIMTLVLLLVYCKSFNVLFCAWFVSQKRCKVKASFSFPQIFRQQNFMTFSPFFTICAINQRFKNML